MKLLFIMMHPGYLRNYDSVIDELTRRGHEVHLRFNNPWKQAEDRQAEKMSESNPRLIYHPEELPKQKGGWRYYARFVRGGMDYLLYFNPEYWRADKLRARVELKMEARIWRPVFRAFRLLIGAARLHWMWWFLTRLERAVPPEGETVRLIEKEKPDGVLITPMVNFASDQTDAVRAAMSLGIKTVLCVASWDNLTNKGLIRATPDRIFVWNNFQRAEAERFHFISGNRVIATGAQCYDKWFEQKPSSQLADFCSKVNLPPRPYLLYLCSSPFIAPNEPGFVRRWIQALRSAQDPVVRNLPVLIRPHPQNTEPWKDVEFPEFENVAVYPRSGANPVTPSKRGDFYDSIYHSVGVVGINTSSMIEAGILKKPVFAVLDKDFSGTQEGTLHFHHLIRGGLLTIAEDFAEHVTHLTQRLAKPDPAEAERRQRFIESFVRPRGIDRPATPLFVDELETFLRSDGTSRDTIPFSSRVIRSLVSLVISVAVLVHYLRKKLVRMALRCSESLRSSPS